MVGMERWNDTPRQCFVVSPIGEQGTERFETFRGVLDRLIRPAIETSNLDLRVIRADEIHRPGSFIRDVLEYLAGAYLVIVDLTGQNANVFYELGVRHALSPRTILIARATTDIPADLREYRTLIYSGSAEGDEAFRRSLRTYLEEIEKEPEAPDNPVLSWLKLPRVPDDLRQSFTARLANAGSTQREVLRHIEKATAATGTTISQHDIEKRFNKGGTESYYRLEQLRLLGFITKEGGARTGFAYRLAPDYRRELGLPEIVVGLALASRRGKKLTFGDSIDAPPAYFYYVKTSNYRRARLRKVRVMLGRVRILDADDSVLEDYEGGLQLKWQVGADRCAPKDIAAGESAAANLGFIVKDHGCFQLDVCAEPWPAGFPGRLEPPRRMRVDLAVDVSGARVLAGASFEIAWDGTWSDDAAQMDKHLVITSVTG
jgi:hypothetical protein